MGLLARPFYWGSRESRRHPLGMRRARLCCHEKGAATHREGARPSQPASHSRSPLGSRARSGRAPDSRCTSALRCSMLRARSTPIIAGSCTSFSSISAASRSLWNAGRGSLNWFSRRSCKPTSAKSPLSMKQHAGFGALVLQARAMKRHPRRRPLSFRAWEAVNKLKADLAYRTPSGRPMKHVVLRRDLAAALLATIQGMLRRQ